MNNIIDIWSKLKEITEETIKVPFTYMMFFLLNGVLHRMSAVPVLRLPAGCLRIHILLRPELARMPYPPFYLRNFSACC